MSRAQQKLETRQRVFEAALQVFRAQGVQEARIEDITALAGVSRGSFYFHFPTREAVLDELLERAEEDLTRALVALPGDTPLAQVMETMALAFAERWKDEPRLFVEVGLYAVRRTATSISVQQRPGVRGELGQRFKSASQRGELRPGLPPEVLADFYLANSFTVGLAWSADPSLPLAEALRLSAHLFLHGAAP